MKTGYWRMTSLWGGLILSILLLMSIGGATQADARSVGVYIYETLEGYHQSMGVGGTVLADSLRVRFEGVRIFDNIPLESNESVRILDEMTEGREVVLTPVVTILNGTAIAPPAVTMSDDALNFQDLTWHVDQDAVIAHAKENNLTHVLIGRIEGRANRSRSATSSGRALISVQATANLRLLNIADNTSEWSQTIEDTQAGFDARVVFDRLVMELSRTAAKKL